LVNSNSDHLLLEKVQKNLMNDQSLKLYNENLITKYQKYFNHGFYCSSTDNLQFSTKTALVGEKIFKGKFKKTTYQIPTVTKICILPKIDVDDLLKLNTDKKKISKIFFETIKS
jgi:hypothetical protein